MKKIFALTAALILPLSIHAQAMYNPGEHDNVVTAYAQDSNGDIKNFPIEIRLTNPTIGIGSVSAYFYFDDNTVRPWVWDEDEECYAYDYNSKRCYKTVTVKAFLTEETNQEYPAYLFVNALDDRDFKLTEGTIVTIYIDATQLSEGKHTLHVVEPMCSYANADGTESASYFCAPQDIEISLSQGVITVADAIRTVQTNTTTNTTYDLQGRRLTQLASHGISIVGGQKIIR